VRAYSEDAEVRIAVAGGTVAVAAPAGGVREQPLHAGDVATVTNDQVAVEHGVDVTAMTGWTSGQLVFDRAPMTQVVAELSRWYAVHVVVEDRSLGDRPMTITVNGQPVDEVLQGLAAAARAHVERRDGGYVLFTSDHATGGGAR
jgi:transmembrane sensor